MAKIKVFHIVEAFGGGVFNSVSQLCNSVDSSIFKVYVAHALRPETPRNYRDFFREHVDLIHVPMVREISPLKDLHSLLKLSRVLRTHRPDAVHLHSSKAGVLGRVACKALGIRNVLYSPRGFSFLRKDVSRARRWLFYFLEKIAAWFGGVIVGCSMDEYAFAKKLTENAVFVQNAVDLRLVEGIKSGREPVDDMILVGTSGRITSQKAPEFFCGIAAGFSRDSRVKFLWIGDGELRGVVEKCGGRVEITGWRSREETLQLVSGLDIYIQTSLWEGMPISVLEAMALRKPVIATDIVGNRDLVISGRTGFLATGEEGFVRHLKELIGNRQLRKEMGDAAFRLVSSEYEIGRVVKEFEAIYKGLR